MKMLNIACGNRYHKDWINIDFHPASDKVRKVNILQGLPFEENSIDVIYSSHFLEHLTREQADFFLQECYRILKKVGIIRLVVPDLENICREYLRVLEEVKKDKNRKQFYEWITIELLDQLIRTKSGGYMRLMFNQIIANKNYELARYILHRTGDELLNKKDIPKKEITFDKLKNKLLYYYLKVIKYLVPKTIRENVFVETSIGERHLWMYDSYSISKKLENIGFIDIRILSHNQSQIPDFNSYLLDIKEDGTPYKGVSSLYVEAIK